MDVFFFGCMLVKFDGSIEKKNSAPHGQNQTKRGDTEFDWHVYFELIPKKKKSQEPIPEKTPKISAVSIENNHFKLLWAIFTGPSKTRPERFDPKSIKFDPRIPDRWAMRNLSACLHAPSDAGERGCQSWMIMSRIRHEWACFATALGFNLHEISIILVLWIIEQPDFDLRASISKSLPSLSYKATLLLQFLRVSSRCLEINTVPHMHLWSMHNACLGDITVAFNDNQMAPIR